MPSQNKSWVCIFLSQTLTQGQDSHCLKGFTEKCLAESQAILHTNFAFKVLKLQNTLNAREQEIVIPAAS